MPNVIKPTNIQKLVEIYPPPKQNTVEVCNQINFFTLHYINSRLVIPLKFIDVPRQFSDIFDIVPQ